MITMKLYIIHVGYYDYAVGMYELHSQFLIAAKDASTAKNIVINKSIFKEKKMHIDGIQEINNVEGYKINLEKTDIQIENRILSYNEIKEL